MKMSLSRRAILQLTGSAVAAVSTLRTTPASAQSNGGSLDDWEQIRSLFPLSPDTIHMSAMLLSSHPAPVSEAIEDYRRELDENPVEYLEANNNALTEAARSAAGDYLGVHASHIALTDSTTMGVGLVYNGLRLRPDDEVLATEEDYFVTHESLRLATERVGASMRAIPLFERAAETSRDEVVGRIVDGVEPATRLIALTWVHSSTGLKIPIAEISAAVAEVNAERDEEDQVLIGLDAVHGFGVENTGFLELGCDFLMAGCHKWLFGPRGTGIVALSEKGLAAVEPTIPSFTDDGAFSAWVQDEDDPPGSNDGQRMTPGGFKAFEHRWALTNAFELHDGIDRQRVADRTHELAGALKEELADIPGVLVRTPRDVELSSGIVSFDIEGLEPADVVARLRDNRIIGSVAPYAEPHVRLTPSIRNSEAEIEQVAAVIRELA